MDRSTHSGLLEKVVLGCSVYSKRHMASEWAGGDSGQALLALCMSVGRLLGLELGPFMSIRGLKRQWRLIKPGWHACLNSTTPSYEKSN